MKSWSQESREENGSITVFLTLMFVILFSLILVVVENTRVISSEGYVTVAAGTALETLFGSYNKELYEEYGLLAYGGYDGITIDDFNGELKDIIFNNLKYKPEQTYISYQNIYRINSIASEIRAAANLTDRDIFDQQVKDYLTSRSIHNALDSMSSRLSGNSLDNTDISNMLASADSFERGESDSIGDNESINSESTGEDSSITESGVGNNTGVSNQNGTNNNQHDSASNPLTAFRTIVEDGILSLVCDTAQIPEMEITDYDTDSEETGIESEGIGANVTPDNTTEHSYESAGKFLKDLIANEESLNTDSLPANIGADKLGLIAYSSDIFSSYSDNRDKTISYGLEYLIAGQNDEKDNLSYIVNRLLIIRIAVNMAYIMRDTVLQEKSLVTATTIAGVTGIEPLIRAVQYTILTILGFEEACVDVCALLQAKKIPLVKNASNFKMKYEEICLASNGLFDEKAAQYSDSQGSGISEMGRNVSYEQYLCFMEMFVSEEKLRHRMCDLIQQDLRERFNQTFCVDSCITEVSTSITYNIPLIFNRVESGYMNISNGITREVLLHYGYTS